MNDWKCFLLSVNFNIFFKSWTLRWQLIKCLISLIILCYSSFLTYSQLCIFFQKLVNLNLSIFFAQWFNLSLGLCLKKTPVLLELSKLFLIMIKFISTARWICKLHLFTKHLNDIFLDGFNIFLRIFWIRLFELSSLLWVSDLRHLHISLLFLRWSKSYLSNIVWLLSF